MQEWDNFWTDFLNRERLNTKVKDLIELDAAYGKEKNIVDICREIYANYPEEAKKQDDVRKKFLEEIDYIVHSHLQTSRIKSVSSLLRKVIIKKHEAYKSKTDPYKSLTDVNYQDIITDITGVRVILSYRGDWASLHEKLLKEFPLKSEYQPNKLFPHRDGEQFIAEQPKAYYARGDDISVYQKHDVLPVLHKKGYRSVHYTISYLNTYIEVQVRTIYDEAWSDVDHRYVYKQEAKPNNEALRALSLSLCQFTNLSDDIGGEMRTIFYSEEMSRVLKDNRWVVSKDCMEFFASVLDRLDKCRNDFQNFYDRMALEGDSSQEKP